MLCLEYVYCVILHCLYYRYGKIELWLLRYCLVSLFVIELVTNECTDLVSWTREVPGTILGALDEISLGTYVGLYQIPTK